MAGLRQIYILFFDLLRYAIIASFYLIKLSTSIAQSNLGIPPIINFPKNLNKGGTQTWDMTMDGRGIVYYANNDGLLEFSGTSWTHYKVPNQTIIRTTFFDSEAKRIYVGAQNEFGFFQPNAHGNLTFHSLIGLLNEKDKNFEDIWQIVKWKNAIFFRSSKSIIKYQEGKTQVFSYSKGTLYLGVINNQLFIQNKQLNLLQMHNSNFEPMPFPNLELKSPLTGVIPWMGDTVLLTSLKNGIFFKTSKSSGRWVTKYDKEFIQKRIYVSKLISNNKIAIGTSLDGCIILNNNRQALYHFNKKNGIQNNNVLSIMEDKSYNLWLGLDNGIDCVLLSSPFTTIIPNRDLQSTGYAAEVYKGNYYFGQSDGAYVIQKKNYYDPLEPEKFKKIPCSDGQVWSFAIADDILLMGHHEGSFAFGNSHCETINGESGAWTFLHLRDNYYLVGGYKGVDLYEKMGNKWHYLGKIKGLDESSRFMVKDEKSNVWISHPYRGVFKLSWAKEDMLNPLITNYNNHSGLPSLLNNTVFKIRKQVIFGTQNGIYFFDEKLGKFKPELNFNKQLGKIGRIKCLKEDKAGNMWYIGADEAGLLKIQDIGLDKKIEKLLFNELQQKLVGGFEFIYTLDNDELLFGAEHGFMHYSPKNENEKLNVNVFIGKITSGDSLLFGGWDMNVEKDLVSQSNNQSVRFTYHQNSMVVHLATSSFGDLSNVKFRTRMIGLSEKWTAWSNEYKIGYTNLVPNKYNFECQAINAYGKLSPIRTFSFTISPPWYKTTFAFVIYVLVLLSLLYNFVKNQEKKFEAEKAKLKEMHEVEQEETLQEVENTKAALVQIQDEKLEDEIEFKNKELALATMHLVQKGELLHSIKSSVQLMIDKSNNNDARKELQSLINLLSFDEKLDEDWAQFAYHFDKVHVDFLNRLRSTYPQLTPNDEKLCAYLRMNLNIKETAQMLNISIRGVEASRYRLRKKLNLANEANLAEFMMSI